MPTRPLFAVLTSLVVGTTLGGIGHAREAGKPVRTCEPVSEETMVCDDGTICYMLDGLWVCEPNLSYSMSNSRR